jgi:S-adenosylmethionine:tRNA ribosyltransferase-isomerase
MHPKNISILDYTYSLPDEKIANYPLPDRDASKLLILKERQLFEDQYKNIAEYLPENALLIFNNTKVIEARILFQKSTGALIEIFCLEPHENFGDISKAMSTQKKVWWKCLVGGASKWKHGQVLEKKITVAEKEITLNASIIKKEGAYFIIEFYWEPESIHFAALLHKAGLIPLPPYIKRETEPSDTERYQTVYAEYDGSVAAPTAGLHFTESIFQKLTEKNIRKEFVTLHVGAGTFKPVKSETLADHQMHSEYIVVNSKVIQQLYDQWKKPVFAVGTTSLRTMESLYWLGLKTFLQPTIEAGALTIKQWDPYELLHEQITVEQSLYSLLAWLQKNNLSQLITKTELLIAPGYEFKLIDGLITNFHQPQSTLLLLVAALVGDAWKRVYEHALKNDYRFLSYGDGCLLFKKQS